MVVVDCEWEVVKADSDCVRRAIAGSSVGIGVTAGTGNNELATVLL